MHTEIMIRIQKTCVMQILKYGIETRADATKHAENVENKNIKDNSRQNFKRQDQKH